MPNLTNSSRHMRTANAACSHARMHETPEDSKYTPIGCHAVLSSGVKCCLRCCLLLRMLCFVTVRAVVCGICSLRCCKSNSYGFVVKFVLPDQHSITCCSKLYASTDCWTSTAYQGKGFNAVLHIYRTQLASPACGRKLAECRVLCKQGEIVTMIQ